MSRRRHHPQGIPHRSGEFPTVASVGGDRLVVAAGEFGESAVRQSGIRLDRPQDLASFPVGRCRRSEQGSGGTLGRLPVLHAQVVEAERGHELFRGRHGGQEVARLVGGERSGDQLRLGLQQPSVNDRFRGRGQRGQLGLSELAQLGAAAGIGEGRVTAPPTDLQRRCVLRRYAQLRTAGHDLPVRLGDGVLRYRYGVVPELVSGAEFRSDQVLNLGEENFLALLGLGLRLLRAQPVRAGG
jgi:hypothetical protein